MGFLQKFFSLGGKRSKRNWKQHAAEQYEAPSLPVTRRNQDDHEATVNRLLRSSSANFAAMEEEEEEEEETPLAIPPSIHRISGTPTMSTASLASTHRGTYTVTVHPRTIIAQTEFPNANPEIPRTPRHLNHDSLRRRSKSVPITPKDKARLLGLRADPSVASLLNMYDEHGCLDSKVFSNSPSPQKEGRVQTQRTGSTLRELLGGPSSMSSRQTHDRNNSALEGDISWAERFLCESADSSSSSLVHTPNDAHFNHDHLSNTVSEARDLTINQSDIYPAFSSLEVELSMATEGTIRTPTKFSDNPYIQENYVTPHRASEVFDFLTAKKSRPRTQSQPLAEPASRPFPELAQASSQIELQQSHIASLKPAQPISRFSSYSSRGSHQPSVPSSVDIQADPETPPTQEQIPSWPSSSNWIEHHSTAKKFREDPEDNSMMRDGPKLHEVVVNCGTEAQANRVRGPRPPPKSNIHSAKPIHSRNSGDTQCDQLATYDIENIFRSNCAIVSAPDLSMCVEADKVLSCPPHRSTASRPSTHLSPAPALADADTTATQKSVTVEIPYIPKQIRRKQSPSKWARKQEKENYTGVRTIPPTKELLPVTPVRTSVFRPPFGTPPSPASSSDLSPVAQQLMADLRAQRMAARQRYKKSGKWSTTTSKLKF